MCAKTHLGSLEDGHGLRSPLISRGGELGGPLVHVVELDQDRDARVESEQSLLRGGGRVFGKKRERNKGRTYYGITCTSGKEISERRGAGVMLLLIIHAAAGGYGGGGSST